MNSVGWKGIRNDATFADFYCFNNEAASFFSWHSKHTTCICANYVHADICGYKSEDMNTDSTIFCADSHIHNKKIHRRIVWDRIPVGCTNDSTDQRFAGIGNATQPTKLI